MGNLLHTLKEITSFITTFIILVILFTSFAVMFYSLYYVTQFINEKYFVIPFFLVIPFPVLLGFAYGIYAYVWYIFLAITITISVGIFTIFGLRNYIKNLMKSPLSYKTNSVKELSEVFSEVIFLSLLITMIMRVVGVQTPGIGIEKMPLYAQMLQLLHAAFYEELVVRFLLLGVPVFLWRGISMYRREGKFLSPLRVFGGHYEMGVPELTFLFISSAIFGLAHTPAWGWWKFLPAFIAGLGMGYLYLKYGMHLSILFHFTTDYMTIPMAMNSQVYLTFGLLFLIIAMAGLVFTVSYSIRILQHFGMVKKEKKITKRYMPPPPWIDIKCPKCGGQNFIYLENGKLKCLNCGTVFEPEYQEQSSQLTPEENPP